MRTVSRADIDGARSTPRCSPGSTRSGKPFFFVLLYPGARLLKGRFVHSHPSNSSRSRSRWRPQRRAVPCGRGDPEASRKGAIPILHEALHHARSRGVVCYYRALPCLQKPPVSTDSFKRRLGPALTGKEQWPTPVTTPRPASFRSESFGSCPARSQSVLPKTRWRRRVFVGGRASTGAGMGVGLALRLYLAYSRRRCICRRLGASFFQGDGVREWFAGPPHGRLPWTGEAVDGFCFSQKAHDMPADGLLRESKGQGTTTGLGCSTFEDTWNFGFRITLRCRIAQNRLCEVRREHSSTLSTRLPIHP